MDAQDRDRALRALVERWREEPSSVHHSEWCEAIDWCACADELSVLLTECPAVGAVHDTAVLVARLREVVVRTFASENQSLSGQGKARIIDIYIDPLKADVLAAFDDALATLIG